MKRLIGQASGFQKMLAVDPRVGSQQGTSRALYHAVTMDLSRSYEFFTNLNSTSSVFKNIDQNKLSIGEAIAIKRIYLDLLFFNPASTNQEEVTSISTITNTPSLMIGKIDIVVGNQTVLKDYPINKIKSAHNQSAQHVDHSFIELENELILKSNVEFKVILKQLGILAVNPANTKLMVTLDGYGKIYNSKENI